jgi:uncharacterized repeat protein (TIGR01451 family)
VLPAGLTFVSATPSQGAYNSGTGVWTVGAIANGAAPTLQVVATVTTAGNHVNNATRTATDQPDPNSANDTGSASVNGQQADIGVTKTVDVPAPLVGQNVTFTITATDNGPSNATGIVVTDQLPAGLAFVSATPSQGTYTSATGVWSVGAIPSAASRTLAIIATVLAPGAKVNTATRTAGDQPDGNPANDSASATVTPQQADIGVAKTVNNATPNVGANVTFTVTATNNGPTNATGVVVTDVLPAGLTFVSATPSQGAYSSGTGAWTVGAVANGAAPTLQLVATVATPGNHTNTATRTAEDQVDSNAANDSASASVNGQQADIAVTKTVNNATPNVGTNVTFTITATNNGPSDATGVALTDVLPLGTTFVSSNPSQGSYNSGSGVWTVGAVANSAAPTLQLVATVTSPGNHTNTAIKTAADQPDPNSGNDSGSASVNGQQADIAVTKTVDNATPNVGADVTFTVTATNNGPSNATGVVVTDLLPAGLSFVSATPSQGAYNAGTGVWTVGAVANGAAPTLQVTATVTQPGPATNTAMKTVEGQPDPIPGNNTSSATVTPQQADVAVAKAVSNAAPSVGSNVTFTITASDNGPSDATGVVVTDLLPADLTFVSATPSQGTYTSGTGAWAVGAIANGASKTLQVVATVTTPGSHTNTATKTAEDQFDPTSANNAASASVNGQQADIAVTKTVASPSVLVGQNATFTVTATDNGPSDATGVVLTDLLPAGLTFVSATPSQGTYTSGTGAWAVGAIANGAAATLQVVATVSTPGGHTNTATRSGGGQPDPNPGNDSASASVNGQQADIGLSKTVDNATPNINSNVTFTVTATNNGPDAATGVVVTDVLPAGLAFVSATPSQGTYNSGTGAWAVGAVANGAMKTLQVVATATQPGLATNTATRTGEDQVDTNAANDSASAAVNVPPAADIQVSKTVNSAVPLVGAQVTYTITAHNAGPSNATGVQLTDMLPAGLTFVSATPSQGTYTSGSGIWAVGVIANGASPTLAVTATVAQAGTITNTATKTGATQFDPNTANDTASAGINGQAAADVATTKTASAATAPVGQNVTYTITEHNNGPLAATGVVVSDPLGAGLTFVSATPSQGAYSAGTGAWTVGGIASGGTATLQLIATVTQLGVVGNTATQTVQDQADPNPNNNTSSVNVTGTPSADIQVTKAVDNAAPALNANVVFTVHAINHGPQDATGVQVTDQLPAGLQFVSSSASQGAYTSGTGVWTVGSVANGVTATLAITAKVTATGAHLNTATKNAEIEFDPNSANNQSSASVNAPPSADIAVTKTVNNATPNIGANVVFTVTAANSGPDQATGVVLTDLLPAGLTLVSATPSQGTYTPGTGFWAVGAINSGAAPTLAITATVTRSGTITNTASKTAEDQADPSSQDDTASASVVVPAAADIAVTKTADDANPLYGATVHYTVTAHNNGPDGATGVQLSDLAPAGLTVTVATPSQGTYTAGTGLWDVGGLVNGATATLAITATADRVGAINNVATKTAEAQVDPVSSNDSASASVNVRAVADIGVTKVVDQAAPVLGSNVTYTIVAANHGPNDATGVVVTDPLPAGLTLVTASATQGSYVAASGAWSVGSLANGASATLTLVARATQRGATTNTATRTAEDQVDNNASNDAASAAVTPIYVDLTLHKTLQGTLTPGQPATYVMAIANEGTATTSGIITVTDTLPAALTFISASGPGWTCGASGQLVTCTSAGPMAPGAHSSITLVAGVAAGFAGTILNTGTVTTAGDVDSSNDTGSSTGLVSSVATPPSPAPLKLPVSGRSGWLLQALLALLLVMLGAAMMVVAGPRRAA